MVRLRHRSVYARCRDAAIKTSVVVTVLSLAFLAAWGILFGS